MLKTPIKRNPQGRFALKNDDYRSVRSLRLTDFTWQALGNAAEALLLTKADLLEQMFRSECFRSNIPSPNLLSKDHLIPGNTEIEVAYQPCITRSTEEIKLKAEIQYLRQQNAWLKEQVVVGLPLLPLEVLHDAARLAPIKARVLKNFKLGKQAPKYKAIQKALNHFITLLATEQL